MMTNNSGGILRKVLTRVLAAGALLAIYAVSTLAVSGVFLTSTTTEAQAQRAGVDADVDIADAARPLSWRHLDRAALPPPVEQPPLLLPLSHQSGLKFDQPAAQAAG